MSGFGEVTRYHSLQGKELEDFRRSLRELAQLKINPVTIPSDWEIEHIPNLLGNYYAKLEEEKAQAQQEQLNQQLFDDYIKDCRKHGESWWK